MKAVLYSTGCPRCEILKKKLDSEGVEYEVCEDVEVMKSLGIMSVPVLKVGEKTFNFSEAIQGMKEILYRAED